MFVKRITKRVMRVALGAAMGGTLFIGACEARALQIAGAGLDAAASLIGRGNTSSAIADFFARQF